MTATPHKAMARMFSASVARRTDPVPPHEASGRMTELDAEPRRGDARTPTGLDTAVVRLRHDSRTWRVEDLKPGLVCIFDAASEKQRDARRGVALLNRITGRNFSSGARGTQHRHGAREQGDRHSCGPKSHTSIPRRRTCDTDQSGSACASSSVPLPARQRSGSRFIFRMGMTIGSCELSAAQVSAAVERETAGPLDVTSAPPDS